MLGTAALRGAALGPAAVPVAPYLICIAAPLACAVAQRVSLAAVSRVWTQAARFVCGQRADGLADRRALHRGKIHSPSPASPVTRLNSAMLVVATPVPQNLRPESADLSWSPWLEETNSVSLFTFWNLTNLSSRR